MKGQGSCRGRRGGGGGAAGLRFSSFHSSKPSWADQVEEEGGEDGECLLPQAGSLPLFLRLLHLLVTGDFFLEKKSSCCS